MNRNFPLFSNWTLFLLLIMLPSFSLLKAQTTYEKMWKKVNSDLKQGLYKSTLPSIKLIQDKAMKESNAPELIRALKAEYNVLNTTSDDPENEFSSEFFQKLEDSGKGLKGNDKYLFEVLKNEFIYEYFQSNQWRITQRTSMLSGDLSQIESWSPLDFKTFIKESYGKLDASQETLQKISLEPYKKVFENNKDLNYFPSLWMYYQLSKIDFLENESLFTPRERDENDKLIEEIYKNLLKESTGNTYLYLSLEQLEFQCKEGCKDREERLEKLYRDPQNGDYKVKIASQLISAYMENKKMNKALELISEVKTAYANTPFIGEIYNLEKQITQPYLQIAYLESNQPKDKIHLSTQHKNLSNFTLKIYDATQLKAEFLRFTTQTWNQELVAPLKKKLLREEKLSLPLTKDYLAHSTSLAIEPLPAGLYVIEQVVDPNVDSEWFYLIVSKDRLILNKRTPGARDSYLLLSRDEGKEQSEVSLNVLESRGTTSANLPPLKSSSSGEVILSELSRQNNYRYFLFYNDQKENYHLFNRYRYDVYNPNSGGNELRLDSQIFLDRGIHRPGQRVYYKAIVTQYDPKTREKKTIGGEQIKMELYDANGELVSSQTHVTSVMGSINGSFLLPENTLAGQFSLRLTPQVKAGPSKIAPQNAKSFRVESYKRPNFEVELEPIQGEYKYGDSLTIKGKALTYSGIPMGGVKVQYEIKKQNIRWRYFSYYPSTSGLENSILGEATTNEKGEFQINLLLEKDPKLEGIQIDRYQVIASLTDLNGETQSDETAFRVASVSHYIESTLEDTYLGDQEIKTKVDVKSYSDEVLDKSYLVTLEKLKTPSRVLRPSFDNRVQDLPVYSKEEFLKKLPYDYFEKSETKEHYPTEKVILSGQSRKDKELSLGKLAPGTYNLTLYNIEKGDTIKTKQQFEVYDPSGLARDQKPYLKVASSATKLPEKGGVKVHAFSAVPNTKARFIIQDGSGETLRKEYSFKNGVATLEVDQSQTKNENPLWVGVQLIALDAAKSHSLLLPQVIATDSLTIETSVFRDRLEPGSKEKWSFKIRGKGSEKIQSEVLASMYDQSLDVFAANDYNWMEENYNSSFYNSYDLNVPLSMLHYSGRIPYANTKQIQKPYFTWRGRGYYGVLYETQVDMAAAPAKMETAIGGQRTVAMQSRNSAAAPMAKEAADDAASGEDSEKSTSVKIRENLNETAFFYPDLKTDASGNLVFEFTTPEALTRWKLQLLAHTKDLRVGLLKKEVYTEKKLSITPNYPRFLREGDQLSLSSRISSIVDEGISGTGKLEILDALTLENISSKFEKGALEKPFSLSGKQSTSLSWDIEVPKGIGPVAVRFSAVADGFSDGEQKILPVLLNRKLVTETKAILVRAGETKTFTIDNLKNGKSATLEPYSATLELVTQPIWEVLFALPSLKSDTYKSADVQFNKWFADVLATEILKKKPELKRVFEQYRSAGELISDLDKNQELKEVLLKETPWVMEAKNEKEQMEQISRLFDASTMQQSVKSDWEQFRKYQNPDGGFSWYPGFPSSYGTSIELLKNLGRLSSFVGGDLGVYAPGLDPLVRQLIRYTDTEVNRYRMDIKTWYPTNLALGFLDARRYWDQMVPLSGYGLELKNLLLKKLPTLKLSDFSFYGLHRTALIAQKYGLSKESEKFLTYLKETSVESPMQGQYWKTNLSDWGSRYSAVWNHAGALEAFQNLRPSDKQFIEELKIWLLTQKQVGRWDTSRTTTEVIFLMVESGEAWSSAPVSEAEVTWGKESSPLKSSVPGYIKESRKASELSPDHSTVSVTQNGKGPITGGLFYQYFEDLDQIKGSSSVLNVTREFYRVEKTVDGERLMPISQNDPLKVGDRVRVRILLNTDRAMENLHLKDLRASGMEPAEQLSGYMYKGGLGYYRAVGDSSNDFFIEYLSKGKHVFEYDLLASVKGNFSMGVATLQNYYAPEMSSTSQGSRMEIKEMNTN